jgi:hypothetical protein
MRSGRRSRKQVVDGILKRKNGSYPQLLMTALYPNVNPRCVLHLIAVSVEVWSIVKIVALMCAGSVELGGNTFPPSVRSDTSLFLVLFQPAT